MMPGKTVFNNFPHVWFLEPVWDIAGFGAYWFALFKTPSAISWVLLLIFSFPLFYKLIRHGYSTLRTPFDLPIAFLTAGMLMGLVVSPDFELSLIALQSYLVLLIFYFTVVNHPHPVLVWSITIGLIFAGVMTIALAGWSILPGTETIAPSQLQSTCMYGPATILLTAALLLGGIALFHQQPRFRILFGILCLTLIASMAWEARGGIAHFFSGGTIEGRIPLWKATLEMLRQHPLTGIGLGAWPLIYHQGTLTYVTHPHSAYLELYCNTGILGVIALILGAVICVRLGWSILKTQKRDVWYGLGIGILVALLAAALLAFIEQWPSGMALLGTDRYHYVILPMVPFLAAALVIVRRKIATNLEPVLCPHLTSTQRCNLR